MRGCPCEPHTLALLSVADSTNTVSFLSSFSPPEPKDEVEVSDDGEWGQMSVGQARGMEGRTGRNLMVHTHPDLCPADEKEPEVDYRTVTVNTEQKVSDVYDIEERLGS